jgi:hypothetical protein
LKIPTVLLVVLVGLAPIGVFASLIIVPSNVKWQPPLIWETKFGTPGADIRNTIRAVTADQTGVYAVGWVGKPPFGNPSPTPSGDFLKKFDFNGREIWSQQIGNASVTEVDTLNIGSDGLYVSGFQYSNQTVFLEKHNLDGSRAWTRNFENITTLSGPWALSVGASGLYIVGLAPGTPGSRSVPLVMRNYDLNGNVIWTRALANAMPESSILVYVTSTGIYLAVSDPVYAGPLVDTHAFVARYDLSGVLVWNRQFDNHPSFECACVPRGLSGDASGIYVGGQTYDRSLPGETSFSYGGGSFLRKYDWNGGIVWTTGKADSGIGKISVNQLGIYLFGEGLERYDGSNGNRVWSVAIQGGAAADLVVGENRVYTGGSERSSDIYTGNALLVGYDQSASLVLGGVNPPYSFLILGAFPGAVAIGIILARRSWAARNRLHSEGELPDVKVSRQRQDAAGQWWVEKQLAQRAAEKWPGLNEEEDHDKDKVGSEDQKSSE